MTTKGKSLIVIATWAIAMFCVFCCSNILIDVFILVGIIASKFALKHFDEELHDVLFPCDNYESKNS